MSINQKKIEELELLNKFLMSQVSELDNRVRTLEIAILRQEQSMDESNKKIRSKLDYLLKEIHKLRD